MERLFDTRDMSREDWLKARKMGIGGSDAGAICGLNPYVSPVDVYLDKTSDALDEADNEAMRQGRDLEAYVADRFMEAADKKVRKVNAILGNKKFPFAYANVDRMISGENAGLECKTASAYSADRWKDGAVPKHYEIQCHHYMAVTGADAWYLAVVILGKDFKYVKIDRDEEIIKNLMTIEKGFWNDNVVKRIPPDPDGSMAADQIIKEMYPFVTPSKTIELPGYESKLSRYEEVDALMKKLDTEKKQIEQEIKVHMEDAESARAGKYFISWKSFSSDRLDSTRLKIEKPDLYKEFSKHSETRRFLVKAA